MKTLSFDCLVAKQADDSTVLSFVATAEKISKIARISRVGRGENMELFGFQRSQIGNHIHEIYDYLETDQAVLPNAIILAFTEGVTFKSSKDGKSGVLEVELRDQQVGLIVDGQQRFSALSMLDEKKFEVFVSALICKDEDELQRQFILINNTKPLSKDLIYELLPTVDGLPPRLSSRSFASHLTQELNFSKDSIFNSLIKIHTNPMGVISPNAVQKVIMNSRSHGAMRDIFRVKGEQGCFELINNFFEGVVHVFEDDWYKKDDKGRILGTHNPRTSRLIHGAGITALGHLMDAAFTLQAKETKGGFIDILNIVKPFTAWSSGTWDFKPTPKQWSEIQNVSKDIRQLSDYLYSCLTSELRKDTLKAEAI